jgi:hypothetical protein
VNHAVSVISHALYGDSQFWYQSIELIDIPGVSACRLQDALDCANEDWADDVTRFRSVGTHMTSSSRVMLWFAFRTFQHARTEYTRNVLQRIYYILYTVYYILYTVYYILYNARNHKRL